MRQRILTHILAVAIGVVTCMYFDKDIHEIEETVIYKDRVKTVVKEIIKESPDGTKITERVTDTVEKKETVAQKKETVPVKPNWGVGIKYDVFTPVPVWGVEIERRVLGDLFVGAYGRTDGAVGVGIKLLF